MTVHAFVPRRQTLAPALCVLCSCSWLGAAPAPTDVRRDAVVEAVQRVMPSVVNVATEEVLAVSDPLEDLFREFFGPYYRRRPGNTQYSLGSGVVIDEDGYVLTNHHVVSRARRVWVKFSDGTEHECDKVNSNTSTDLALLKIRAKNNQKFPAVELAGDDDLLLGETVVALGNPFGLGGTVTRGILSSKSRRPPKEKEPMDVLDWLQTDAAINPGNSGGPLINLRGQLIGINVAVYREAQGIGFAVPVKRVAEAIGEIYSPEQLERLWFGARIRPGSPPLQITAVQPESPAGKAGLRAGDLIVQLNGRAPRSFIDFMRRLTSLGADEDFSVMYERGGERRTARMRLVPEKAFFNAELVRKKIGLSVQDLTRQLASAMGWGQWQGVLISGVDGSGPAAGTGLESGMLITSVDGQPAENVQTMAKIVYARNKGEKVRLEVVYTRERGFFIEYRQVAVELAVP